MRGGLVFFRGAGAEARAYLESDHSHADEYYLEHGQAEAQWTALDGAGDVITAGALDGDTYQAWVDWKGPEEGEVRGIPRDEQRIRSNGEVKIAPSSPRFVEMTVNADKSLSVAAALSPAVSAALDEAEAAAVRAMNSYMAQNSVTRVGPRGAQRFVPVERLESVAVVHRSSRAGDPHRHVHVQWNTRVYAEGQWRGLHTAATLKQQGALRGVGEAAINSHAGLRAALAQAGFDFDPMTGKVRNLEDQARVLSKRAAQIERNVSRFEAEWRAENPGQEPGHEQRREWDTQAWAFERPQKRTANMGSEEKWIDELRDAGLQVDGFAPVATSAPLRLRDLAHDLVARDALTAAEAHGSAWSIADLEGHIGTIVGMQGVHASEEEVNAYVSGLARRTAAALPRLEAPGIIGELPSWVRNMTSDRVLQVERYIRETFEARGLESGLVFPDDRGTLGTLNMEQSDAARALASAAPLVVIEGAAGSGKTTMLGVARELAAKDGRELMVVAPTLRAAAEAAAATGVASSSAHKLAHEYGFRWTEVGAWTRLAVGDEDPGNHFVPFYEGPSRAARVSGATRIVVDEAGMMDQDLMAALVVIANENGAQLALVGDRAQLPAVGRGGVLDMAIAAHPRPLDMSEVHRFREPGYAELTLQMRERRAPGALFDTLLERGNIVLHDSDAAAVQAIANDAVVKSRAGATVAVAVASNESATQINAMVQAARAEAGHTRKPAAEISGTDNLSIRVGDRLMTRRNRKKLGVANRDTWTVKRVHRDGSVSLVDGAKKAKVPAEYVRDYTHLAYASTEYGVQGATVDFGHGQVTESSTAGGIYVPATRGREHNALHIVAGDQEEARQMFIDAMNREGGDRGVEAARNAIVRDMDGMVATDAPVVDQAVRAERIAYEGRLYEQRVSEWERARASWQQRNPGINPDQYAAAIANADAQAAAAAAAASTLEQSTAAAVVDERSRIVRTDYYDQVVPAERAVADAGAFRRRTAEQTRDDVRAAFVRKHGIQPAPTPPAELTREWVRRATMPGASPALDQARKQAAAAQARAEALRADPAPATADRPARQRPGTPQQEAARDAAYLRRLQQRRQGEQQQRRERERTTLRRPNGPTIS